MTLPALALLVLFGCICAVFIHAAWQDARERRRRERAQAIEDYRDILGRDE